MLDERRVDAEVGGQHRPSFQRGQVFGFAEDFGLGQFEPFLAEELQLFIGVIEVGPDHVGYRSDRYSGAGDQVPIEITLEFEYQHDRLGRIGEEIVERRDLDRIDHDRAGVAHGLHRTVATWAHPSHWLRTRY